MRFLIFRTVGNFLILLTIFGFFATFGPAAYYEFTFRLNQIQGVRFTVAEAPIVQQPQSELGKLIEKYKYEPQSLTVDEESKLVSILEKSEKEKILIPKSVDFSIVIPKIGASAKVFSHSPNWKWRV